MHCTIYQYYNTDSANKKIVGKQTFNEKGKIVHEWKRDYLNNADGLYVGVPDGDYYSIFNDTLLVRELYSSLDSGERDSTITDYYYDEFNNCRMKIQYLYQTPHRSPEEGQDQVIHTSYIPKRWFSPDTTVFMYDGNGRRTQEFRLGDNKKRYFGYDTLHRLLSDSCMCFSENSYDCYDCTVAVYTYVGQLMKRFQHSVRDLNLEPEERRMYLIEWLFDFCNRVTIERRYSQTIHGKKVWQEETKNEYGSNDRIFKEVYRAGNKTTTRVFVYD